MRAWQLPARRAGCLAPNRTALREFPDLIAVRGADLVTVDAKERMSSTDPVNALLFTAAHAPTPLYYVFGARSHLCI